MKPITLLTALTLAGATSGLISNTALAARDTSPKVATPSAYRDAAAAPSYREAAEPSANGAESTAPAATRTASEVGRAVSGEPRPAAKTSSTNTSSPAADANLGRWKIASDASFAAIPEGWWKLYDDPALSALVERALAQNQDLVAAAARVDQARAAAGLARSAFFPSVQIEAGASRGRSLDTLYQTTNYISVPLTASYELDLWGRVRNSNRAARRDLVAQAELFAAARLALSAEVAQTFISVRGTARELEIVRETVDTRREARDVIAARLRSGTATDLDLARAETELATVEAEASGIAQQYAQLQNALAVLVGEPAPSFRVAVEEKIDFATHRPPAVPVGLPGSLLERRPDIAAAQNSFLAANARIKVAKAAFFPDISITGAAGYESADFDNVFRWDQRVWSFGPRLYLPIFQGGRNRANLGRAEAAFDEAVAQYRQSVLVAFREVQDALTASRLLDEQVAAQERAAANARKAAGLSRTRYDAGYVGYLEVVDSERSALGAERALVQLRAQRLVTSVVLIKALGGGWAETVPGRS